MDRQIVWPGAMPLETDILSTNRNVMVALGVALQDVLPSTLVAGGAMVAGCACSPTSPASMSVSVAAGRIYCYQSLDATAYSSLAADTVHSIIKQGLVLDPTILGPFPAPGTAGQSINYLIECTYQDTDTNLIILPYFDSQNPTEPFAGPNNSSTPQATTRAGQLIFAVKAGTAATSGSQVTPTVDTGYFPLWVVTVAAGAVSLSAGNITQHPAAPFHSGTVSMQLSGCTTTPAVSLTYTISRNIAYLSMAISALTGTSNSNTAVISNVGGAGNINPLLLPKTAQAILLGIQDNGTWSQGYGVIQGGTMLSISLGKSLSSNGADFTPSGTKGVFQLSIPYKLN